jgi:4-diphosphocytidyl-2C-methyl-D-erythritol kinase
VRRTQLQAPAKLNLGLRITGRRQDGYHELESLFVPLALADELAIELSGPPGVRLELSGVAAAGVPADERNLAWRAAAAFAREARLGAGVSLALAKRVPSPAGRGGGSSDAGAVLRGLAILVPGAIALSRLAELALSIGADVPFFLAPRPALVRGIGERIIPVAGIPALPVVLAHPGAGLETKAVYAAFDAVDSLTPPRPPSNLRALLALREETGAAEARWPSSEEQLHALVVNDLEPAAQSLSSQPGAKSSNLSSSISHRLPDIKKLVLQCETLSTANEKSLIRIISELI